jgi:UDP-glucose 4-epimerase
MNVCVIGGAGYIGSHVVRELLDKNYSVTVYDNLSSGIKSNLFSDTAFIEGDILDYSHLNNTLKNGDFSAVFHFAAFKAAGESMIDPQKFSTNNINGTINILNAVTRNTISNFVFSSSAAVYGEPQYIPVDENHQTNPENYYGFTKLEIERILHWYDKICSLRFAALRYFNAAGYDRRKRIKGLEKNPQNLLPCIMETAAGTRSNFQIFGDDYDTEDGTGIRDYVHVSDLADAHVKALEYISTNKKSLTVNLGSENGISVKKMLNTARTITGKEIPSETVGRRAGDPAIVCASSKKAGKLLGWKAKNSDVETLIESTWEMYKHLLERT